LTVVFAILAFLVTLGILIVVHEWGHYRAAVACNVKVLRFSVGFGRVLWSRRMKNADATELTLSALPLGGYVRMLDEREGRVAPGERDRAFNTKPLGQRAFIVAAGPASNLILAVVLYALASWVGVEEPKAVLGPPVAGSIAERAGLRAGDWVRASVAPGGEPVDVRSLTDLRWATTQAALDREPLELVVSDRDGRRERRVALTLDTLEARDVDAKLVQAIGIVQPFSEPVLGEVKAGGAGAAAGLRTGDRVLAIDGRPIVDAGEIRNAIRANGQSGTALPMVFRIDRDGRMIDLSVTPAITIDRGERVGRIEVAPGQPPERVQVRYGPVEGAWRGVTQTWTMSALTIKMLGRMLIGEASLKNLSGPVTIADYAGQSARLGLAYYLGFLAVVSVSLGVLNLLPLPILDGGHLVYYAFEAATGRPVSDLWLERLQRGGVGIMVVMMSLALYNDMARLLGLQ
jgi:regulator of sigma E protease